MSVSLGPMFLALVTSKDFLFLKIVTWHYRNIWTVLVIVNVDSCQHGGQYICVSCFFCVTLAINKSFYFHPVGVSSFFVRMASNLFSCLSVPSSLLPRECSCLGHACCTRFRDAIICLFVIVGLSFHLLPTFFQNAKIFANDWIRKIGSIVRSSRFIAFFARANKFAAHRRLQGPKNFFYGRAVCAKCTQVPYSAFGQKSWWNLFGRKVFSLRSSDRWSAMQFDASFGLERLLPALRTMFYERLWRRRFFAFGGINNAGYFRPLYSGEGLCSLARTANGGGIRTLFGPSAGN